jgi:hypothetical protein
MGCWHVVLLIDDSLVTRETQQSITVEQMSEKGRPSYTMAIVLNVNGTYHSLVSENKMGDMRGY